MTMEFFMNKLVNKGVQDQSGDLQQQFQSAQPFRHIVINDFLETDFASDLLDSFPAFDEKLAINENGEVGAKAVHEKITDIGPDWRKLDKLVQSDEFRTLVSDITGIPKLQFDPHYFGGGTHENLHGQGLSPHVDFTHRERALWARTRSLHRGGAAQGRPAGRGGRRHGDSG